MNHLYKIYNAQTGQESYEIYDGVLTFDEPYILTNDRGEITQSEFETLIKFKIVT